MGVGGFRRDQEEGGELDPPEEVTFICGSRRDQEEGGGAGLSRKPRRDQDQKSWAQKVGLLLLQLFLNSSATDIVLVTRSVPHSS